MKILGCVLIITSTTLVGIKAGKNLEYKRELLKEFIDFLVFLSGEIKYSGNILENSFENISKKINEPYKAFLEKCVSEMKKYDGRSFGIIWESEVYNAFDRKYFDEKIIDKITSFGNKLGYMEVEMQSRFINELISELENEISELNNKIKRDCKLYRTLGVMGGIFIVLIII